jgi:hypothetical protein
VLFDAAGLTKEGFTRDFARILRTTSGSPRIQDVRRDMPHALYAIHRGTRCAPGLTADWALVLIAI